MPDLLKIVLNPNEILRKISKPFPANKIKTPEIQKLIKDMIITMIQKDGVGLAAPQIGKNIRIITINTKDGPICLINPEIIEKSWIKELGEEGCLSVPGFFGDVRRHKKIKCQFLDTGANKTTIEAEGLMARVIQHESDHLDGILFIDKAKNIRSVRERG